MQQPKPETVEKAQAELDQLNAWLAQYEQMVKNVNEVEKRQAYLEGFLVQPADPSTNGTGDVESVELA